MNTTILSDIAKMTFAYIDPGSGGVLISVIAAALAIAFYYLRSFFYEKARYLFKRQNPAYKEKYRLVFYSEGKHYWYVFMPIIRELDRRGVTLTYFTSDLEDPGLTADYASMDSFYIGEGHEAYFVLNSLKADMLIMTTPGLNVLHIKRSKTVKHYCFIQHSLEDVAIDRPYSFDYFDSMMAFGRHQLETTRQIEMIRGLPAKKIEVTGSTYLDAMQEELAHNNKSSLQIETDKKTILLAPSWGDKGFLSKYGDVLINKLLDSNYQIILRPHPQSWKSETVLLENLKDIANSNNKLIWDDNPNGLEAMKHSDLMISDLSGIVFDYILLFAKPVVIAAFEIDPRKYEMNILPSKSSILMRLIREDKIGYQLKESDIDNIINIIEMAIEAKHYTVYIEEFKDHINSYPGEAGKRGADFVEEVLDSLADDQ
jgi:hypothetical protein